MTDDRLIPVSAPELGEREREYVLDCIDSTWISSNGAYIGRFEKAFAAATDARHAVSCNTGTAALHLALLALDIGPGDEVIVPTLTYVASANAVRYCGASVKFVDSLPGTWNLDPADVARKLGPRTKAILAVHLYGEPADLGALQALANERDVALVEDAAEALGALYDGRHAGTLGTIGTYSFYGNKVITTGEGGMVATDDERLARRMLQLRGQGQDFDRRYWFPVIGFNYRMTNIEAAIGLAQLESLDEKLARRRAVAERYAENLRGTDIVLQQRTARTETAHWMVGAVLPVEGEAQRDDVARQLADNGVETRPFFYPVHSMPPYAEARDEHLPVALDIAARGLCLPTWSGLPLEDVDRVCDLLRSAVGAPQRHGGNVGRLTPADTAQLGNLFEALAADDSARRNFHPHPLDRNAAARIANHSGGDVYLGYRHEGELVGYAMLRGWDKGYTVPSFGVAVRQDRRGLGIGAALLRECLRVARERQVETLMLKVHPDNRTAVDWYLSEGFEVVATADDGELVCHLKLAAQGPARTPPRSPSPSPPR